MFREDIDLPLAQLVLREGLVSREELSELLVQLQEEDAEQRGEAFRHLLLEEGLISKTQLEELVTSLQEELLFCPECFLDHNVKNFTPGQSYSCQNCGGELRTYRETEQVPGDCSSRENRSSSRPRESLFGQIAVSKGFVGEEDLDDLVEEAEEKNVRLGLLLMKKGLLSRDEVRKVLEEQNKHIFRCPECERGYNVLSLSGGAVFMCGTCGVPLEQTDQDEPVEVVETIQLTGQEDSEPPSGTHGVTVTGEIPEEDSPASDHTGDKEPSETSERFLDLGGKYDIAGEIDRGGNGVILEGVDRDLRREVAIKAMLRQEEVSPEIVSRFIEEAQVQGQLEHPNICPVHEMGKDTSGRLYFTMKKVDGISLKNIIQNDRRPGAEEGYTLTELLEIFNKVCDALAYAHSRGVIHRDVKPENIMVGKFGEVQVMDWGIAKLTGTNETEETTLSEENVVSDRVEDGIARSMHGSVIGTPAFMAPEQARGNVEQIDERTDIFSLGGLLFYILTGSPPVSGDSARDVVEKVKKGNITPQIRDKKQDGKSEEGFLDTVIGAGNGDRNAVKSYTQSFEAAPQELRDVVRMATREKKEDRYQSVKDLQADIRAFLENRTLQATTYNPIQLVSKWVKRHKRSCTGALTAAAVTSLVVMFVYYLWTQEQLEEKVEKYQSIESSFREIKERANEGNYLKAASQFRTFPRKHRTTLDNLQFNELLRSYRPDLVEKVKNIDERCRDEEIRSVQNWAKKNTDFLSISPAEAEASDLERAEKVFRTLRKKMKKWDIPSLPVAEVAVWRASASLQNGNETSGIQWVSRGFQAKPESRAASRGFYLLAKNSFRNENFKKAALQCYRSLISYGDRYPELRGRQLLYLARSLANLGPEAKVPFEPGVRARRMALRAILKIVTPAGNIRNWVKPHLSEKQRQKFEAEADRYLDILKRIVRLPPRKVRDTYRISDPLDFNGDGNREEVCLYNHDEPYTLRFARLRSMKGDSVIQPSVHVLFKRNIKAEIQQMFDRPADKIDLASSPAVVDLVPGNGEREVLLAISDYEKNSSALVYFPVSGDQEMSNVTPSFLDGRGMNASLYDVADLDDNGCPDLVYGTWDGGRVFVRYQLTPGSFSDPREITQTKSHLLKVFVRDLDRNGTEEIVVLHGPWSQYKMKVFQKENGNRTIKKQDEVPTAAASRGDIAPVSAGEQTYIVSSPALWGKKQYKIGILAGFELLGYGEPDMRVKRFAWNEKRKKFESVPLSSRHRSYNPIGKYGSTRSLFMPGESRSGQGGFRGFIEYEKRKNFYNQETSSSVTWYFWADGQAGARPVSPCTVRNVKFLSSLKWILSSDVKLGRDILRSISGKEFINRASAPPRKEHVAIGKALLEYNLFGAASRFARNVLSNSDPEEESKIALKKIQMKGLASQGSWHRLQKELDQLQVREEMAVLVLSLGGQVAEQIRRYEEIGALFERWGHAVNISPSIARKLRERAQFWKRKHAALNEKTLSMEGKQLKYKDDTRNVYKRMITNRANFLYGKRGETDRDKERAPFMIRQSDCQLKMTEDAGTAVAGLPVEFHGKNWRFSTTVRFEGLEVGQGLRIGLLPEDMFWSRSEPEGDMALIRIVSGGGNMLFSSRGKVHYPETSNNGRIDFGSLIGEPLRFELEYLAGTQKIRFWVIREKKDTVVYHNLFSVKRSIRPGRYIVGVSMRSSEDYPFEGVFRIQDLELSGNLSLLGDGEFFSGARGSSKQKQETKTALRFVRARISGNRDLALKLLNGLLDSLIKKRKKIDEDTIDNGDFEAIETNIICARTELLWIKQGNNPTQLLKQLKQHAAELADKYQQGETRIQERMYKWILDKPYSEKRKSFTEEVLRKGFGTIEKQPNQSRFERLLWRYDKNHYFYFLHNREMAANLQGPRKRLALLAIANQLNDILRRKEALHKMEKASGRKRSKNKIVQKYLNEKEARSFLKSLDSKLHVYKKYLNLFEDTFQNYLDYLRKKLRYSGFRRQK